MRRQRIPSTERRYLTRRIEAVLKAEVEGESHGEIIKRKIAAIRAYNFYESNNFRIPSWVESNVQIWIPEVNSGYRE